MPTIAEASSGPVPEGVCLGRILVDRIGGSEAIGRLGASQLRSSTICSPSAPSGEGRATRSVLGPS